MDTSDYISLGSVAIATVALFFASLDSYRARKDAAQERERAERAENLAALLGEKETVAFAALKMQKEPLPSEPLELALVYGAIVTACVFTSSDRARALLFNVIDKHRTEHQTQIQTALDDVARTFTQALAYKFPAPADPHDKFDLGTGLYRINLLNVVFTGKPSSLAQ